MNTTFSTLDLVTLCEIDHVIGTYISPKNFDLKLINKFFGSKFQLPIHRRNFEKRGVRYKKPLPIVLEEENISGIPCFKTPIIPYSTVGEKILKNPDFSKQI